MIIAEESSEVQRRVGRPLVLVGFGLVSICDTLNASINWLIDRRISTIALRSFDWLNQSDQLDQLNRSNGQMALRVKSSTSQGSSPVRGVRGRSTPKATYATQPSPPESSPSPSRALIA